MNIIEFTSFLKTCTIDHPKHHTYPIPVFRLKITRKYPPETFRLLESTLIFVLPKSHFYLCVFVDWRFFCMCSVIATCELSGVNPYHIYTLSRQSQHAVQRPPGDLVHVIRDEQINTRINCDSLVRIRL